MECLCGVMRSVPAQNMRTGSKCIDQKYMERERMMRMQPSVGLVEKSFFDFVSSLFRFLKSKNLFVCSYVVLI